jgi:hypothetical protein
MMTNELRGKKIYIAIGMFVWFISHRPAVLFSQNKSANRATSQQYFSLTTSNQPQVKRTCP